MLLSTQTDVFGTLYDDIEAVKLIAKAGFDAYDMSFFQMSSDENYVFNTDEYLDYAHKLRAAADEAGIVCNQAHAPFPSYLGKIDYDEDVWNKIIRSMEVAAILGAKNIVVHPVHHVYYWDNIDELKKTNKEFYAKLLPYAEKFGINIATENMWQRHKETNKITHSVAASPKEFAEYVDMCDSPYLVACLDVGHVALVSENMTEMIHTLGKDRLKALHIHDNDLLSDSHTAPFTMEIDFHEITKALKDIGYEGDFTFEADNFLRRVPDELKFDALCYLEKIGRQLIKEIEE